MRNLILSTLLHLHDVNQYNAATRPKALAAIIAGGIKTVLGLPVAEFAPRMPVEVGEFIGLVRIDRIDNVNRNCAVGLDLVGAFRGRGLSAKIYAWLLDYLFHQLNMHMVYLEVLASNERAIHVYKRIGFHIDGRLRQKVFRNGAYEDSILMSLLRSEYDA